MVSHFIHGSPMQGVPNFQAHPVPSAVTHTWIRPKNMGVFQNSFPASPPRLAKKRKNENENSIDHFPLLSLPRVLYYPAAGRGF